MKHSLTAFFERDLQKLRNEIDEYPSRDALWSINGEIKNSGGNLALHISGAVLHFIGSLLGGTGYVRDRDLEFSQKGLPKEELIRTINLALETVEGTMNRLTAKQLRQPYPVQVLGQTVSAEDYLIHLLSHINYHLGQVNYHRRLTCNK